MQSRRLTFLFMISNGKHLRTSPSNTILFEFIKYADFFILPIKNFGTKNCWSMGPCIQFYKNYKLVSETSLSNSWSEKILVYLNKHSISGGILSPEFEGLQSYFTASEVEKLSLFSYVPEIEEIYDLLRKGTLSETEAAKKLFSLLKTYNFSNDQNFSNSKKKSLEYEDASLLLAPKNTTTLKIRSNSQTSKDPSLACGSIVTFFNSRLSPKVNTLAQDSKQKNLQGSEYVHSDRGSQLDSPVIKINNLPIQKIKRNSIFTKKAQQEKERKLSEIDETSRKNDIEKDKESENTGLEYQDIFKSAFQNTSLAKNKDLEELKKFYFKKRLPSTTKEKKEVNF